MISNFENAGLVRQGVIYDRNLTSEDQQGLLSTQISERRLSDG